MKLRNKNTGDTVKFVSIEPLYKDKLKLTYLLSSGLINERYYTSIEKFNDDWEDYEPKEPLIKDEKVRKAVRAWAEANEVLEVFIDRIGDGTYIELYDEDDGRRRISTLRPVGLEIGEAYTIDELCGEEEE